MLARGACAHTGWCHAQGQDGDAMTAGGDHVSGVHRDTYAEAAKRGRAVLWPGPRELFVDLDSEWARERFEERLALLQTSLGQKWAAIVRASATAGHYHATVTMHRDVVSEHERICLQAVLGSDANRELFSWVRHELDARPVSCFFEVVPVHHAPESPPPSPPPLTFIGEETAGYDLVRGY